MQLRRNSCSRYNQELNAYVKERNAKLIGPNCPGVITQEKLRLRIMPGFVFKKGTVGIVSKSGT